MMETHLQVRSFDSALSPDEFRQVPRNPVYPILDNLRSAFNVGSIIRTADCILVEKMCFCGYTAHPPHKKLDKTSLGALPYVPWQYYETTVEAIQAFKEMDVPIVALELTNRSQLIWEYEFPLPVALVLGNEALGVSREALELADVILEIPMLGYKNSINVAVAFGIVAYEIQRQHWQRFAPQLELRKGEG
jgi:tRNA G18 (ribose-2'-O)-methylase SpoU